MKTFVSILFTVNITLCISSCTQIIFVSKTLDPEIILEKKHNDIVFVNLFDYTLPVYVKEKNEVSYHAGVMKLAEGLSSFSRDESFSFFMGDTLKKGIEPGLLTVLLPTDSVSAICTRNRTGMLLALDSMNIFFDWETIVDRDNDGGKNKTKNFYLYTRFYMSLYSATGDLINRSNVDRSSFYKSRPALSGLITIKPSIAKAREEVENLAFQAGKDYVSKFYPQLVQVPKKIYTGKPFRESNSYIKTGNSNKAIELLDQLVKSPDPKIANKARQNLSVVKEMDGMKGN